MESVKKSIDERAQHKREYDSWVNERQMQTTEEKVDMSKALDASLVDTECSGTDTKEQDTSNSSRNDAHDDDADIKPIYDEEPMVELQTTAKINIFPIRQHHAEQPEFNNEGEVDQNAEECHDTYPLPVILTDNQTPEHSYQTLEFENICLKKTGFKEFSTDEQGMTSDHKSSEFGLHDYSNEQSSSKLVPKVVPPVDKTATS
uniref:Uncharacterized protein n=1 Tax=Tanacetum cinerariifolium TaxID=118510 RepID=A0A699GJM1_TANCI|nr:hypothetical protein [Tanacetum cinerariifolium]